MVGYWCREPPNHPFRRTDSPPHVGTKTRILYSQTIDINRATRHDLGAQPARRSQPPSTRNPATYFARSRYSPVAGFTRTFSPVLRNSGTFTVTPFSSVAGLVEAVFVADFITGAVSTISSTSEFGI